MASRLKGWNLDIVLWWRLLIALRTTCRRRDIARERMVQVLEQAWEQELVREAQELELERLV